jgi:hypothetical protein
VVENLPLPNCELESEPYFLAWLADLSARRLLNRVHNSIYGPSSIFTASANAEDDGHQRQHLPLFQVPAELDRQLQDWFRLLPPSISPDAPTSANEVFRVILKLRYHATGDIIFRPFLFQALALPSTCTIGSLFLRNCESCLYHCRGYLGIVGQRSNAPSAQTEIVLHRYGPANPFIY